MFESESHYKTLETNESQNLQAHSSDLGQDVYHRGPLILSSGDNPLTTLQAGSLGNNLNTEVPSHGHRRHATSVSNLKQPSANFAKRKFSLQRSPKKGH